MSVEVLTPDEWTPQEAADYAAESWRAAVESIIETGRRLKEGKRRVGHGQWLKAIDLMPFGERTVQRLILVAEHPDISNPTHGTDLPASLRTLATLAQLPEGELQRRIEAGEITPELTRSDAEKLTAAYAAANQEMLNLYSTFCDNVIGALSYSEDFVPPTDPPDNYLPFGELMAHIRKFAANAENWESVE